MKWLPSGFGLILAAVPAGAQCSLCRLAVEQDASLGTAFNKAILMMMIPALAVLAGIFAFAFRSAPGSQLLDQNSRAQSDDAVPVDVDKGVQE
jgi:hypothetical protein